MYASVTGRAREVKQPRGGYIKPSQFEVIELTDPTPLHEEENLAPNIVGMAVDYLTRMMEGKDKQEAFIIPLSGAYTAEQMGAKGALKVASRLFNGITDLDDDSIINACKLTSFDIWKRNPLVAPMQKTYKDINPDQNTIENIRRMVWRGMAFFDTYGPVTYDGFTFDPPNGKQKDYDKMIKTGKGSFGGYTPTVATGDGDFLTSQVLWDFKVSKSAPTSKDTLQLLMYWIMGKHSGQDIYKDIIALGIYNPRLHKIFLLSVNAIPEETIHTVEKEVIGY